MKLYKLPLELFFILAYLLFIRLIWASGIFNDYKYTHGIIYILQSTCLIGIVVLLILSFGKIKALIWENGTYNLFLLSTFIFGFVVRYFVVYPQSERMGLLDYIVKWVRDDYFSSPANLKVNGWVFLLKAMLLPFQKILDNVLLVNIIMGSFFPILIFFLVKLLFNNKRLAFISSSMVLISPLFLYISSTESTTSPAIFFTMLTFIFLFFYIREQDMTLFILSLLFLSFAIQMRVEYVLVIPIFLFTIIQYGKKNKRQIILFFVLMLIMTPYIISVLKFYISLSDDQNVHSQIIDESDQIQSYILSNIGNTRENLSENIKILSSNKRVPIQIILLAIPGLLMCFKERRKESYFLLFYFLIFFFAYTSLHREGFKASYTKYIPSVLLPLIVFASIGILVIFKEIKALKKSSIILPVLITLVTISFLINNYAVLDTEVNRAGNIANRELFLLKKIPLNVDTDCKVFTNGFGGPFPYYYPFTESPVSISDFKRLEEALVNMDNNNCYYFYQAIVYSRQKDRTGRIRRIFDTASLSKRLEESGFRKVLSFEIDNKESIVWNYP